MRSAGHNSKKEVTWPDETHGTKPLSSTAPVTQYDSGDEEYIKQLEQKAQTIEQIVASNVIVLSYALQEVRGFRADTTNLNYQHNLNLMLYKLSNGFAEKLPDGNLKIKVEALVKDIGDFNSPFTPAIQKAIIAVAHIMQIKEVIAAQPVPAWLSDLATVPVNIHKYLEMSDDILDPAYQQNLASIATNLQNLKAIHQSPQRDSVIQIFKENFLAILRINEPLKNMAEAVAHIMQIKVIADQPVPVWLSGLEEEHAYIRSYLKMSDDILDPAHQQNLGSIATILQNLKAISQSPKEDSILESMKNIWDMKQLIEKIQNSTSTVLPMPQLKRREAPLKQPPSH